MLLLKATPKKLPIVRYEKYICFSTATINFKPIVKTNCVIYTGQKLNLFRLFFSQSKMEFTKMTKIAVSTVFQLCFAVIFSSLFCFVFCHIVLAGKSSVNQTYCRRKQTLGAADKMFFRIFSTNQLTIEIHFCDNICVQYFLFHSFTAFFDSRQSIRFSYLLAFKYTGLAQVLFHKTLMDCKK